jgi:hypothetical protein
MRNIFTSLVKTDPFKKFAAIEKQSADLDERFRAYQQLDGKRQAAITTAQAEFDTEPTVASLEKLELALTARIGFIASDLHIRIVNSISAARDALTRSPASLAVYRACLVEIQSGLESELRETRSKLTAAFREAGDPSPNLDAVPAIRRLLFQLEDVSTGIARMDHPVPLDANTVARLMTSVRGQLPEPPAPQPIPAGMITHNNEALRRSGGIPTAEPETFPPGFFGPVTLLSKDDVRKTQDQLCRPPQ